MLPANRLFVVLLFSFAIFAWSLPPTARGADTVTSQVRGDHLEIKLGQQVIAEYVWKDEQIARPYFRHLRTRSGIRVTRTHPPVKGEDIDDHPTMHPGLWLAFGDINGVDFWRNKGRVSQVEMTAPPEGRDGGDRLAVQNSYEHAGTVIATEDCRVRFEPLEVGYVIHWRSTFRSQQTALTFGDQEEMGLGVRVATPLAVVKGGQIVDSEKRRNGAEVWGKQADWCEYGGTQEGRHVGIVLMPGPRNFRRAWFHARDYGLLVANPFGRQAFTKGQPSQVVTPAGQDFVLEFDVLVYDTAQDKPLDVNAVYQSLANRSAEKRQ